MEPDRDRPYGTIDDNDANARQWIAQAEEHERKAGETDDETLQRYHETKAQACRYNATCF
jgi:hypothetical protein